MTWFRLSARFDAENIDDAFERLSCHFSALLEDAEDDLVYRVDFAPGTSFDLEPESGSVV